MDLNDSQVIPVLAVSDMGTAPEFYEGKLGLPASDVQPDGGVQYPCGAGSSLYVYPSPANAGKSTATLAAFLVDDIDRTVDEGNIISIDQM